MKYAVQVYWDEYLDGWAELGMTIPMGTRYRQFIRFSSMRILSIQRIYKSSFLSCVSSWLVSSYSYYQTIHPSLEPTHAETL